jgi:hypothetical protein
MRLLEESSAVLLVNLLSPREVERRISVGPNTSVALKLEFSPKKGQVGVTFSPDNFVLLEDFIPPINALHINEHVSVNVTDHLKIECLEPRNVRLPTLSVCPFS